MLLHVHLGKYLWRLQWSRLLPQTGIDVTVEVDTYKQTGLLAHRLLSTEGTHSKLLLQENGLREDTTGFKSIHNPRFAFKKTV
jgi:hypothetical protein